MGLLLDTSTLIASERRGEAIEAIGIEIVGRAIVTDAQGKPLKKAEIKDFEPLTAAEQASLYWLIPALLSTLRLKRSDIYRHPMVGYKVNGEAADARF